MKALSSTTRTLDTGLDDTISLLQRADLDPPVIKIEVHAAPVIETGVLGEQRYAFLREHLARGRDVSFAHVDARARHELPEHARAADDLGADASSVRRAELLHLLEHHGHDRLRKLRRIRRLA